MRSKFAGFERSGWLLGFIVLSLLLHTAILYGSRGWLVGGLPTGAAKPRPGEIVVTLQPAPKPEATPGGAPHRAEPTPAPVKQATPAVAKRPEHNDVPIPFQPHPRTIRGVAPKSAPQPVSRTDVSPQPQVKPLPVPTMRPPEIAGGKFPDRDLKPLPLGVDTGDRLITPRPVPHVAAQPSNFKPIGPVEAKSGSGSAPGPKPITEAKKDDEVLPTGNGGTTGGQGAPQGRTTGSGGDEGGQAAGMTRGVPFGDPGGVLQGGDINGGGGKGGGPGGPGSGRAYSGGGGGAGAPVHVVYVLDMSESMRENDKIGKSRAALRQALSELQPEDSFDIIYFADDQHIFSGRGLVPATPNNVEKGGEYLSSLRPRGATNYSAALDKALSLPGVTHVVLMSDGIPTLGIGAQVDEKTQEIVIDDDALLEWIRHRNKEGIHILTLGLGLSDNFDGKDLLQDIASQNRGVFKLVNLGKR